MDSVQDLINALFGGEITIEGVANLIAIVWAIAISIIAKMQNTKLVKADKESTATDAKLDALTTDVANLTTAIGILGDILSTTMLSSSSTTVAIKKVVAASAQKLSTAAGIPLADATTQIIDALIAYIPGSGLAEKKEEIVEAAKKAEEIIDEAAEAANTVVDKLRI